jgi:hypothetical protein
VPGEAVVARDAYGSRFLFAVPFSSGEAPGEGDHWYAWDVDTCWLAAWLLGPSARSGLLGDTLVGGEHRELIREYFRSRRRGQLVLGSLPGDGQEAGPVFAAEIDTAPFVDWYAGQHADAPKPGKFRKQAAETAEFLLLAWGPREHPAEETVYSCSPHRVEMLGRRFGGARPESRPRRGRELGHR